MDCRAWIVEHGSDCGAWIVEHGLWSMAQIVEHGLWSMAQIVEHGSDCLCDPAVAVFTFEPCQEKTCLRDVRPGKTQTSLLSYRV